MSWYKEGAVNIEQGSNTVIGIGTKWANPLIGVCAGQMLILKTANTIEICEIASVQSDTQLTLVNKYEGETKSGVNYEIPTVPKVSIEALALRISEMLNYYQQQMEGWQAILTGEGDIKLKAPDGRVVTIKSQRALTETINNTIKSQNELTKTINDAIDSQNKLTETVNNTIKKSGENSQLIKGSLNVDELIEKGQRVYSPNNKPIPDDIGALAATKTVVNNVPTYKVGGHLVCSDWIGKWDLMPFRRNELPFGWYFRNGDNYLLSSPQGQALNSLSANYKSDHRITIKTINGLQYINVPTAFAPDGRGYFIRAVNGTTRQVGTAEDDAIRNIYGELMHIFQWEGTVPTGVFSKRKNNAGSGINNRYAPAVCGFNDSDYPEQTAIFNAAQNVPTAYENRVINIGGTPVIYLGI